MYVCIDIHTLLSNQGESLVQHCVTKQHNSCNNIQKKRSVKKGWDGDNLSDARK